MSIETIAIIVALIVSVIGILVQLVGVGIYLGKLEGFKTLVEFRFKTLETKQDRHNGIIERTFKAEGDIENINEKIKVANHRIEDLENEGR